MARNKKKTSNKNNDTLMFQVTESYKKARTNLVYSIIKKGCKKIIVTSPFKSEGKTTTTINVAIALSQQVDTKVLVIDCDLRRPTVHSTMNISSEQGLANFLNDECELKEIISHSETENLDFITFGAIPPNPSELLSSENMTDMVRRLEMVYDYIIFDTPPINMVVDMVPLIGLSDGIVVVVRHNSTTYPELTRAVETIRRNSGKIVGLIINEVPTLETSKGGYYLYRKRRRGGYSSYGYESGVY
ncbi:MAG: CpsD/CapB family tyrosine-protein kinase [Ruminococcus sp.]|nr:CpsD/CapB family tyrosine-protein kinase [Ruminococcus sp.]